MYRIIRKKVGVIMIKEKFKEIFNKFIDFYNKHKDKKQFKIIAIAVCVFLLAITIMLFVTCADSCGNSLKGDDRKVYNLAQAVFQKIDEPENSDLLSGCIDEFGDGYFLIGSAGKSEMFYVDGFTKKVYNAYDMIMYFGEYSYEYSNYPRLCSYEDPSLDYEAINKQLDKKFS